MKIPLVDLKAQYASLKDEVDEAISGVVNDTQFILGPEVKAFEHEMAAYCQTKLAIGVASGTDALHLSLLACGIGPGDEVITTPFTFIATAETITHCGAVPVFVDIEPGTYNIDPARIKAKITKKTKAILPVHLYGQPADMAPILELARKHGLKVIEDCAQALGAEYKGQKVGSLGDAGCLSFFPSKMLGAYGDGGTVVTDNPEIAEKVTMLRNHGGKDKHFNYLPGFNSRLDALQAAILRAKLRHLEDWIERRRRKAALYSKLFQMVGGVEPPHEAPNSRHVFNYYTVRLGTGIVRAKLQQHLGEEGIASVVYYPLSLHLQPVYQSLGYKQGDLPRSEQVQNEVLSLPIYPELGDKEIEAVVKAIENHIK
jgi:dTDP-4-amino-4,6-dideoxygalactose transaminase